MRDDRNPMEKIISLFAERLRDAPGRRAPCSDGEGVSLSGCWPIRKPLVVQLVGNDIAIHLIDVGLL